MFSLTLVLCCTFSGLPATQFDWPVYPKDNYRCDQNQFDYNPDHSGYHLGEDWNGKGGMSTDKGDPVYCVANGRVVKVDDRAEPTQWGKVLVIAHTLPSDDIVYSVYAHVQKILVNKGDVVSLGQKVATIGDANGYYLNAAHLHFALMKHGPFPPKAKGYVEHLYLETANDYYIPSLFISNRQNPTVISLNSGGWKKFVVADQAPISTAYVGVKNRVTGSVEYHSFTKSLSDGTLKPIIRSSWQGENNEFTPSQLADFIFVPNGTKYALKSLPASSLYKVSLVIFPVKVDEETIALRAKSDMLCSTYAYGPEFLEALPETFSFSSFDWPEGVINYHSQMSFVVYDLPSNLVTGLLKGRSLPLLERGLGIDVSFSQTIVLPHISPNKVD